MLTLPEDASGAIVAASLLEKEGSAMVSLREMSARVQCSKTPSTAKGYLAVIRQLEAYCGGEVLWLENVSGEFVAGFGRFLAERNLSAASVAMYKRTLRALLRDAFGSAGALAIKSAFAGVESANETDTHAITAEELRKVAYSNLGRHPWLGRVRDVFMLGVYGCGLTFERLKELAPVIDGGVGAFLPGAPVGGDSFPAWRWMREAAEAFGRVHGMGMGEYLEQLSAEGYSRGLAAIGGLLRLRHPLTPKSAVDGWIATARELGVSAAVAVAAARGETAYKKIMGEEGNCLPQEEMEEAACKVAGAITDLTERWYAMRCFADTPEAIAEKLQSGVEAAGRIETYVPGVGAQQEQRNAPKGGLPLGRMLFFRCKASDAMIVKRHMGAGVYVFSFRDGDRTPAFISTGEMMTFMLLCDVAGDTIRYFFPGETEALPEFAMNETVTVTNGMLTGHVGIVDGIGKDRLKVFVRIEAMNGAIVTAEIPSTFLRHAAGSSC